MNKVKLVKIAPSDTKTKKLKAEFILPDGSKKTTNFGAKGYSDYTIHKDPDRKERYIARHKSNEDWSDPTSAGALSRYVLWNKPSLKASISDYKKKFNL